MSSFPAELPSDASDVLRVCAVAETSTVTDFACTESAKSIVAGWLTSNSADLVWSPKPEASTTMIYLAGGIWANVYAPELSATADVVLPVALSVMVILAPGTRAPEGSLIVPRSDVVASWPKEGATAERIQRSIHPRRDFFTANLQKILAALVVGSDLFFVCTNGSEPLRVWLSDSLHLQSCSDQICFLGKIPTMKRLNIAGIERQTQRILINLFGQTVQIQ